jgi:hypothetical protein
MKNEFVTYEQAVELKKLLYGEHYGDDYLAWYSSNKDFHYRNINSPVYPNNQSFIAPLKQQVFRWFREKHNLIGIIECGYTEGKNVFSYVIWREYDDDWNDFIWNFYEEAENACIDKLIDLVKHQVIS